MIKIILKINEQNKNPKHYFFSSARTLNVLSRLTLSVGQNLTQKTYHIIEKGSDGEDRQISDFYTKA